MQMSIAEIRRVYKYARDKNKQVSILADLNECSIKEILDIVQVKTNEENLGDSPKDEFNLIPEQKALIDRLDELDAMIKPLEDEYKRTADALKITFMECG